MPFCIPVQFTIFSDLTSSALAGKVPPIPRLMSTRRGVIVLWEDFYGSERKSADMPNAVFRSKLPISIGRSFAGIFTLSRLSKALAPSLRSLPW